MSEGLAALRDEVEAALARLDGLLADPSRLGGAAPELSRAAEAVRRRLEAREVQVAVVGEKKAGKSTWLNALLGAPVLGTAVREATGTVTVLRRGPRPDYLALRVDGRRLRFHDARAVELDHLDAERRALAGLASPEARAFVEALAAEAEGLRAARLDDLAREVRALTDLAARGREIAWLELWMPAPHLPDDLVLLDTPGVNTDDEANRARAWEAIRERADGCLLLCDLNQAVSASTLAFLEALRPVVPHVLLALTKLDLARENAELSGGDPEAEVAEAVEVARRRFARAAGRPPEEIEVFTFAALPVLRGEGGPHAARFADELRRLREVLLQERELLLASRAAALLHASTRALREGAEAAEAEAARRLAALEARAIADPPAFIAAWLDAARPGVEAEARRVQAELRRALPDRLFEVGVQVEGVVRGTGSRGALLRLADELHPLVGRLVQDALASLRRQARASLNEAHQRLARGALDALTERYRLAASLGAADFGHEAPLGAAWAEGPALSLSLGDLVAQAEGERRGLGLGGAALGAGLGLALGGGLLWPVALALGGAALAQGSVSRLQDRLCEAAERALEQARPDLERHIDGARPALVAALEDELRATLEAATARFAERIDALARLRAQELAEERARGEAVVAEARALLEQAAGLRARVAALAGDSRGLSGR